MKSMYQIMASIACALALTACGGGPEKPADPVIPAQPAFKATDLVVGKGTEAATSDFLTVTYTGWLYDSTKADFKGTKIDSTADNGNVPFNFAVGTGAYMLGWDQGMVGMKEGGTRSLIIPSPLGFGSLEYTFANKTKVPANSPLVYEVTLVTVRKATNPPVVQLPDTVVRTDTRIGTGAEAKTGNTVTVKYTGWLYDATKADFRGTQFDASTAFDFKIGAGSVIKGWDYGVPGMKVGGVRTLVIPPELAYGSAGRDKIPPASTLVFTIELVTVR